uniref:Uncharacterized protein n=1 Tax=Opuntia streptacantha TaxID=393608 RepID=A0A7C8Z0T1_OPUST
MSCTLQCNLQATNSHHTSIQAKGPVVRASGLTGSGLGMFVGCSASAPCGYCYCWVKLGRRNSPSRRLQPPPSSPTSLPLSLPAQVRGWGFACVRVRPLPQLRWPPAPVTTTLPSTAPASRCRP